MKIKNKLKIKKSIAECVFDMMNVLVMIVLAFSFIYPFWNTLVLSFNDSIDALKGGIYFWPRMFTLDNYITALRDSSIIRSYGITIAKTVLGTSSGLICTGMFAYALSKKNLLFRNLYLNICIVTMFFSGGMIPTYLLYRSLGLLNNFLVYIIPGLYQVGTMIVMKSFFISLPVAVEESAEIDGLNHVQIFFKIVLPLSAPIFATYALMNGVAQWNGWFDAMIYQNDERLYPVQMVLRKIIEKSQLVTEMQKGEAFQTGMAETPSSITVTTEGIKTATMMITIGPIIAIYPFMQKYFVKGMTVGAVKA